MPDKVTVSIDEAFWNIDDPRVDALFEGRMTLAEFVRAYRASDPWQISFRGSAWQVKILPEKDIERYNAELERRAVMLGGEYLNRPPKRILPLRSVPRSGTPCVIAEAPDGPKLPGRQESGCKGCGQKTPSRPAGTPQRPPPRQSCFECVEKCLGVAMALTMGDFDAGRSRLKTIGNLRLAEEYSPKWPELNTAIHAALSLYQMKGDMPDWDRLEQLLEAARAK